MAPVTETVCSVFFHFELLKLIYAMTPEPQFQIILFRTGSLRKPKTTEAEGSVWSCSEVTDNMTDIRAGVQVWMPGEGEEDFETTKNSSIINQSRLAAANCSSQQRLSSLNFTLECGVWSLSQLPFLASPVSSLATEGAWTEGSAESMPPVSSVSHQISASVWNGLAMACHPFGMFAVLWS